MRKRGFTLIELLVVIAILGILAVIIILNLASASEKSRYAKVKSELKNIDDAISVAYTEGKDLIKVQSPTALTDGSSDYDYKNIQDKEGNQLLAALPKPPDTFKGDYYKVVIRGVTSHAAMLDTAEEQTSTQYCAYSSGAFITGNVAGTSISANEDYCSPR